MRPRNPTNSGQLKANERKDTHTTPASVQVKHYTLNLNSTEFRHIGTSEHGVHVLPLPTVSARY